MSKATINDIAEKAQVSLGTVHRALYGKPGVSKMVRERVLEVARELNYQPNRMASSLRKRQLNIVVAFPEPTRENRFFYGELWNACKEEQELFNAYNCNLIQLPFCEEDMNSFSANMGRVLLQYKDSIDGMLIGGSMRPQDLELAARAAQGPHSIPMIAVGEQFDALPCLCTIQSDHTSDGRMAAEELCAQIPENGDILLFAGDETLVSNHENAKAFEAYVKEFYPGHQIRKIFGAASDRNITGRVAEILREQPETAGIYSVSARGTLYIVQGLMQSSISKHPRIVGSDLFTESAQYLKEGILGAVIHKNPRNQTRTGIRILIDHLIFGSRPQCASLRLTSLIVNRGNLNRYYRQETMKEPIPGSNILF